MRYTRSAAPWMPKILCVVVVVGTEGCVGAPTCEETATCLPAPDDAGGEASVDRAVGTATEAGQPAQEGGLQPTNDGGNQSGDDAGLDGRADSAIADVSVGEAGREICSAPARPAYGNVSAPLLNPGSVAVFTCDRGFKPSGPSTLTCQTSGSWSGDAPTCVPVACEPPASPVFGAVSAPTKTYGSIATYSCGAGYVVLGSSTRSCQADGTWSGAAPTCTPQSCGVNKAGAGANCGTTGKDDCCASELVTGGKFLRDNNPSLSAKVSDFRLDRYEVTVGRFRAFVAEMATESKSPAQESGANPHVPGSGWNTEWNARLADELASANVNCSPSATWNGNNDNRPINCISWREAFAFCIWDGGRLPTELEWNYAAAGGSEQRKYPWGSAEPGADAALAVYGKYYGPSDAGVSTSEMVAPVGSVPAGNGKWGLADLAGNVSEWTFDFDGTYPTLCVDCVNIASSEARAVRGGNYTNGDPTSLLTSFRYDPSTIRNLHIGVRCARLP